MSVYERLSISEAGRANLEWFMRADSINLEAEISRHPEYFLAIVQILAEGEREDAEIALAIINTVNVADHLAIAALSKAPNKIKMPGSSSLETKPESLTETALQAVFQRGVNEASSKYRDAVENYFTEKLADLKREIEKKLGAPQSPAKLKATSGVTAPAPL